MQVRIQEIIGLRGISGHWLNIAEDRRIRPGAGHSGVVAWWEAGYIAWDYQDEVPRLLQVVYHLHSDTSHLLQCWLWELSTNAAPATTISWEVDDSAPLRLNWTI